MVGLSTHVDGCQCMYLVTQEHCMWVTAGPINVFVCVSTVRNTHSVIITH